MAEVEGVPIPLPDPRFGKSARNLASEMDALELLTSNPRFQVPNAQTKKEILRLLYAPPGVSHRTFDAVRTPEPVEQINMSNVSRYIDVIDLVELKATRKSIRNAALNGFFFGATKREYDLAASLPERYLFAFVVLSSDNDYGQPFFVLLTLEELERRTRTKRIQFQVNLRSDTDSAGLSPEFGSFEGVITAPEEE
jgi:hypothetical protein